MANRNHSGSNIDISEFHGALQRLVDSLFEDDEELDAADRMIRDTLNPPTIRRLDVVLAAEAADLPEDLTRIVGLLPPGNYTRRRLCDQLNSAITGHAWGQVYGTVE